MHVYVNITHTYTPVHARTPLCQPHEPLWSSRHFCFSSQVMRVHTRFYNRCLQITWEAHARETVHCPSSREGLTSLYTTDTFSCVARSKARKLSVLDTHRAWDLRALCPWDRRTMTVLCSALSSFHIPRKGTSLRMKRSTLESNSRLCAHL